MRHRNRRPDDAFGSPTVTLRDSDLPALFEAADRASVTSRAVYFGIVKAQVALLMVGVLAGTVAASSEFEQVAIVGVAAFIGVAALRVYARLSSVEAAWYDARMAAESVKSLSWRYAIGGPPFGLDELSDKEADELFNARLWELLSELTTLHTPPSRGAHYQITPGMRELRHGELAVRKSAYERDRVVEQANWYSEQARRNERQSRFWDAMFVLSSAVAIMFGLLQGFGAISVNVFGVAGYAAALITMWTGVRHYDRQARAYGITAHELLAVASVIQPIDDEDEWASFVDRTEAVVSEEHTGWRVSRARA
jgi:disulfide bond formation protein DsbB